MKKILSLLLSVIFVFSLAACGDSSDYQKAVDLIENNQYEEAYELLLTIKENEDAKELLSKFAFLTIENFTEDYDFTEDDFYDETTTYKYDDNGNLLEILKVTEYRNGVAKTEKTVYAYDDNGNNISITYNDGSTSTYEYDSEGREKSFTDSTGATTTYEYNKNGAAVVATDEEGNVCEYDANGNVISETEKVNYMGTDAITTRYYKYNDAGDLLEKKAVLTNADTGKELVTEMLQQCTYDDKGNLLTEMLNNGPASHDYTYSYTYDSNNNILTCEIKDAEPEKFHENIVYTYDENGNLIKKETETKQNIDGEPSEYSSTETYTYDTNGNMIKEVSGDQTATYSYDEYGNQIEKVVGGNTEFRIKLKLQYFPNGVPEDAYYIMKPTSTEK